MRKFISAAIILALCTPAMAQSALPGKVALPPKEYDGVKIPGQVEIVVKLPDYGIVRFSCKSEKAIACTVRNDKECLILLGPATHNSEDALRHERGHCAGWAADHKGGWLK